MDAYETGHMISEALRLSELVSDGEITEEVAAERIFEFTEGGITEEQSVEIIAGYIELYKFGIATNFLGER